MTNATRDAAQTTDTVLMVRPAVFFSNPETAQTNAFQTPEPDDATQLARAEFDAMVAALREHGVRVVVVEDTADPRTPDAVFPNNWLSTHADGTLITYPMQPVSRRAERRQDVIDALSAEHGFAVRRHLDLAVLEAQRSYLEGTGSLVLDRRHRRAYACLSPRTHDDALQRFCRDRDYEPIAFEALGADGTPVYHTNVMMCVGRDVVIACVDAIAAADRDRVVRAVQARHRLVDLSLAQMNAFAGNMLELAGPDGRGLLVMSATAHAALTEPQRAALAASCDLLPIHVPTIETAGGSVRCMLAEIFLPKQEGKAP